MTAYPARKAPAAEDDGPVSTPFGVQVLALLSGFVIAWLGFESAWKDFQYISKLRHLETFIGTPGRMLKSGIRRDSTSSGDACHPDVLYEYFVGGRSVWGWRFSYEEAPRAESHWRERLARYPQDSVVTVYFAPGSPSDSILEKERDGLYRVYVKMGLGIAFLLAGLTLVVLPVQGWVRGRASGGTASKDGGDAKGSGDAKGNGDAVRK